MSKSRLQHVSAMGAVFVFSCIITCAEALTEPLQREGKGFGQNAATLTKAMADAIDQQIGPVQRDNSDSQLELARLRRRSFKRRNRFIGKHGKFRSALRDKMRHSFLERGRERQKRTLRRKLAQQFELRQQNHARKRERRVNINRIQQQRADLFREGGGLREELRRRFDRQRSGPTVRRARQ